MTSSNSWAQLRGKARSYESQTEALFHTYSGFTTSPALKVTESEIQTESQFEDIFSQRDVTIKALARLLDSESVLTSSAAKLQNLALHRQNLLDHRREFQRLKSAISETRNRANLLSSVRSDINAYRSSSRIEAGQSEADYMLDERNNIERANNLADTVLSQAYSIGADFGEQRARLTQINRKIMYTAKQIPGINTLIGKINTRKRRDSIIIALLLSACALMVLLFR